MNKAVIPLTITAIIILVVVLALNKHKERSDDILKDTIKSEIESLSSEIHFLQDQQQVMIDSITVLKTELSTITRKETKIYNTYVQENNRIDSLSATEQLVLFSRNSRKLRDLERTGYFDSDGR